MHSIGWTPTRHPRFLNQGQLGGAIGPSFQAQKGVSRLLTAVDVRKPFEADAMQIAAQRLPSDRVQGRVVDSLRCTLLEMIASHLMASKDAGDPSQFDDILNQIDGVIDRIMAEDDPDCGAVSVTRLLWPQGGHSAPQGSGLVE